jgi:glycerophosphoryl diester phosphodiesterase
LTPEWAAAIRQAGYGLAVYTVNEPALATRLAGWGVQCIISDRPDVIAAAA